MTQDILRDLNADGVSLAEFPITSEILGAILKNVHDERITTKSARDVYSALKQLAADGGTISVDDVERIITERGLVIFATPERSMRPLLLR